MKNYSYGYPKKISLILVITMTITAIASAQQSYNNFRPGELWLDNNGVHINAHGGGILYHNDTYYWFGEHKTEGKTGNVALVGVGCYSSKDLYNWINEGIVLSVATEGSDSDIESGCILERPKVIYNEKTGKFVMYFHLELKGKGYSAARTGIAVSDKIIGPYKFIKSFRPNAGIFPVNMTETQRNFTVTSEDIKGLSSSEKDSIIAEGLYVCRDFKTGQMSRDMALYVDDNQKAYHIYSSEENLTLQIAELTDDYQGHSGKYIRLFPGGHNEAPALFKHDGTYWMITSGCTGWEPNEARLFSASSIWGPWKQHLHPFIGKGAEKTFGGQSTFVISTLENRFVFMADVWKPESLMYSKYIWLPIGFDDTGKPVIEWKESWNPC